MVVGMRVIKTALVMAIGVLVSSIFHLQYPFFTVISAIIAMQNTLDDSFKKGLGRIYGSTLGGLAGIIYLEFFISDYILWNATIIGFLAILVMYVQLKLKWSQSIQISLIVLLSICITTREESVSYYAVVRVLDTIIGIGIAFVVNYLIAAPNCEKQFSDSVEQLFVEEKKVFLNKLNKNQTIDVVLLEQHILKIKELYKIYLADSRWHTKHLLHETTNDVVWDQVVRDLDEVYRHICIMEELQLYGRLDENNCKRLQRMKQWESESCFAVVGATKIQKKEVEMEYQGYDDDGEYLDEETKVIYNYHIYKVLDGLERLEQQFMK